MSSHLPDGTARPPVRRPAPRSPLPTEGRAAPRVRRSSSATPAARATRRRRLALLAPLLVLALTVLPSAALASTPVEATQTRAAHAGVRGTATATAENVSSDAETVTTTLVSMTPATIRPGDTVTVVARIHNGTDESLTSPRATLGVSWRHLATRSALDAWADAPTSQRPAEAPMAVEALGPVAPDGEATVTFTVDADDFNLEPGSAWGPRPLSIMVTDGSERLDVLRSFYLWGEAQAPSPVRLSLLAPVTGPAPDLVTATTDDGRATATVDTEPVVGALGADGRLSRLLAATAPVPEIAWAVDPALVASAESSADPDALSWAARLREGTGGRTVFGLRPYDPDAAAYAQVGAPLPAATTPLPGGAASDPTWRTDLTYPATDVPDLRTVRTSVEAGSPLVVVRGDGLAPSDSVTYTPTGLAAVSTDAGPATALVADEALTRAFTGATSTERDPHDPSVADETQRLLADTAVVASERSSDSRNLLIALARSWDPDPQALSAVLATLTEATWVETASLDTLVGSPVPDVARTALPASTQSEGTLPPAEMDALQRARNEVAGFATIAADPAPIVLSAEPALVVPTAVAYRARPEDRSLAVDTAVEDAALIRSSVSILQRGLDVTLINTSGKIPVKVRNTLDQPVTVQVALRPDKALLKVVSFPVGPVPPGEEVDFKVPVRAIGSGDVRVQVELLSVPSGAVVSPPSEFVVQVRAAWENTGTAIFAGLVGLLLLGGIWRTIRRGRSPRRVAELTPATGVPGAHGAHAPSDATTGSDG